MAPDNTQRERREPLYDVHPMTGASIEVFYADRTLETFGGCGGVGFGSRADAALRRMAHGPFATSYSAALGASLGASSGRTIKMF